jgi:hypothetical protein
MIHLMAPVPAVHFLDTVATAQRMGRVLLGSKQIELLLGLKDKLATIWLVESTGYLKKGALPPVSVGKVLYRGTLEDIVDADPRGRPKKPELRPASTANDTEWHKFYQVKDLTAVEPPIPSASLRKKGGGAIEVAPHMLVVIEPPGSFL